MQTKLRKKNTRKKKQVEYVVCLPEYEKDMSHLMTEKNRAYDEEAFFDREIKKLERKKLAKKATKKTSTTKKTA